MTKSSNIKSVDPAIESVVLEYAFEELAHGQTRTNNELRKLGTFVSPSGVRIVADKPVTIRSSLNFYK